MIASNLGQVIGRLMYGGDIEQEPLPEKPFTSTEGAAGALRGRKRRLVQLLAGQAGEYSCIEIATAMGISKQHAHGLLTSAWSEGLVLRTGQPSQYRYRHNPDAA